MHAEQQYLDLVQKILDTGIDRMDRTGVGTRSIFGHQMRFDLSSSFPLLTTKKVFIRGIIHELLWFISGVTNIRPLVLNDVKIWNEWAYAKYVKMQNCHDILQNGMLNSYLLSKRSKMMNHLPMSGEILVQYMESSGEPGRPRREMWSIRSRMYSILSRMTPTLVAISSQDGMSER